ncbi:poly-beta-1,6 N-acetyl-D-glucosamine synthase [Pilibacter termitis]|uniref:Poly-beta-1,6 N-acetyl-D-glucosamine synthase n=1 Tax=Pilibacter termitis TaxID=263852 RepID=A0A1T4PFL2_9ENTE|nr:glycosyltransferase family 2 protein [Pilibacter termitis]SJZ90344.1 poly-beta-1,6 N-acetyl-D-glucosamine synthase [Pilibacter termitis]
MSNFLSILVQLLTLYPVFGSIAWTIGGIFYRTVYVGKFLDKDFKPLKKEEEPMITIMIPCHNEEVMIEETLEFLMNKLEYHNYEVLVCDDGSTDTTPEILARLSMKYNNLRVLRVNKNKGKAHAFNIGISFARGEFILSNDADIVPSPDALWKYMNYFLKPGGQNIAAVTSNGDVQNRTLMVEKSQTVEFSSIVGIIKRSQMGVLGAMYAYSGANTMYRKDAIFDCGGFRQDRATEDISIAWDQQFNGWEAVFAPDIIFYMNVPNTLNMLYHQRKRWAKGGTEAWFTNFARIAKRPFKNLPKIVMLLDQTGSILWSFYYLIFAAWLIVKMVYFVLTNNTEEIVHTLDMAFIFSAFISMVGVWQLVASLALDNHGEKLKYLIFAPSYMVWYWQMNALTIATTLVPAIKSVLGLGGEGTWVSPPRTKMTQDDDT